MRIKRINFKDAGFYGRENRKPMPADYPRYMVVASLRGVMPCNDSTPCKTLNDALTYALARDDKQYRIVIYADKR